MNTPSSSVTPSQMKLWLEILQWRPMTAFRWISTNAPTLETLADPAAVEVDEIGMMNDDSVSSTTLGAIIESPSISRCRRHGGDLVIKLRVRTVWTASPRQSQPRPVNRVR